ncbi:Mov34/MPN/PAD-1 family protein [uncultured Meiothermus sp.]|jgi:integrative and conjugative element protein (TIGR02256 family)|uniref:Mov34/MPN/PAD-1 family protein n=1 Tax=uncultured Meiothermus sp. TaxID=157471 RepID=UPI002616E5A3|nr:Mov34/MPN/PAD-1 family protein [uncultured Meiothermus sp.]
MIFRQSNGGRVKLATPALERIQGYRQTDEKKLAAGGLLLGRHVKGTDDYVVDWATVPMMRDTRQRRAFALDAFLHQREAEKLWRSSGGTCGLLGDWHTHREADPSPSRSDLQTWRSKLKGEPVTSPFLFFVIVGSERLGLWQAFANNRVERLALVN